MKNKKELKNVIDIRDIVCCLLVFPFVLNANQTMYEYVANGETKEESGYSRRWIQKKSSSGDVCIPGISSD